MPCVQYTGHSFIWVNLFQKSISFFYLLMLNIYLLKQIGESNGLSYLYMQELSITNSLQFRMCRLQS